MGKLADGSKKRITVKNLLMAATLSLAFMIPCAMQPAAAQETGGVLTETSSLSKGGLVTGFATELTPTLDKLHEQDPETYPQTSSFTYVDSEADANTSLGVTIPTLNENN